MSILDRKPKRYSTSDLFWEPHSAPTDGAVGDINTMRLDPSHLGMAQDVIIDTNGVLRSRGAFKSITSDVFTNISHLGVAQTTSGTILIGADSTGEKFVYGTSAAALTGFAKLTCSGYSPITADSMITGSGTYHLYSSAKLPNDKGVVLAGQNPITGQVLTGSTFLWGGNAVTTNSTVAGTFTVAVGSKAVVGVGTAWTSALENCYLFSTGLNAGLIGQVNKVTSTTTLTLVKGSQLPITAAMSPSFKTTRTVQNMVYKGRITCSTSSTTVIGANTKFLNSGSAGGQSTFWLGNGARVFRYSDGAYIGLVNTISNDTTMGLSANAAINMTNEEYYIIDGSVPAVGTTASAAFFGTCVEKYADRYWYGGINALDSSGVALTNGLGPYHLNGLNSIAFSKKNEPECLDVDPSAGDILTIPSSNISDQIRGLCAIRGGLVVFRSNDTYIITGYSPETFRAIKILDDGVLNTLSFKSYKEGVVWAGQKSVWYFDGTKIVDLLQGKVGRFYQRSKQSLNTAPPGLAICNDHVLLSYYAAVITWPYKNTTKSTNNHITLVLNMLNGAVSFFTNIFVTSGFTPNPMGTTTFDSVIMTRNIYQITSTTTSFLLNSTTVFTDSTTGSNNFDAVTGINTFTSGAQIGPDVMFETVKLSLGNAARLKFWKMLLANYSSDVSMTASFISTNDTTSDFPNIATGTAGVVTLPVSSNVGILKRIKFLIRAPALSIRVYQTATASATSQRFKLFWYTVGGKWMRQGRQQ